MRIGAFLLRLPESPLKTHLLMRVDQLTRWADFRAEVVAISRAIATAQAVPAPMDIGAVTKGPGKGGGGRGGRGGGMGGKPTAGGSQSAGRGGEQQYACPRCGSKQHS